MITSIQYYYVHSLERFNTFHRVFYDMLQYVFQCSVNCLRTFSGMFVDIPQNVYRHSSECLRTFPKCLRIFPGMFGDILQNVWGMFGNIPRIVWGHSPECLATFHGMFGDITQNVWQRSPKYNIPPIPRVSPIPFSVPVFLVLYLAMILKHAIKLYNYNSIELWNFNWFCKHTEKIRSSQDFILINSCKIGLCEYY